MDKHTPGPWVAKRWTTESDVIGWYFVVCGHRLPLSEFESDNPDEVEANAHLIAAAPELLVALRGMVATFAHNFEQGVSPTVDLARAALAKATGEQA